MKNFVLVGSSMCLYDIVIMLHKYRKITKGLKIDTNLGEGVAYSGLKCCFLGIVSWSFNPITETKNENFVLYTLVIHWNYSED